MLPITLHIMQDEVNFTLWLKKTANQFNEELRTCVSFIVYFYCIACIYLLSVCFALFFSFHFVIAASTVMFA